MQVNSLQHFRDNVARVMAERDLSYREVADMAEMGYPFLHRVLSGKANPSIEVADKIADALGMQLSDLVSRSKKVAIPA